MPEIAPGTIVQHQDDAALRGVVEEYDPADDTVLVTLDQPTLVIDQPHVAVWLCADQLIFPEEGR